MNTKKVDRAGQSLRQLTMMALLFAMAMVLSILESMIPALPMLPPGVKLGLSNIVTMYALFVLGPAQGYTIAVLKSFFVFLVGVIIEGCKTVLFSYVCPYTVLSVPSYQLAIIACRIFL